MSIGRADPPMRRANADARAESAGCPL